MRVNVYTEELINGGDQPMADIVTADYISSRTGELMTNYGLRIFLESSPKLHYIPGRDDDRSAVTFWCGDKQSKVFAFLAAVQEVATMRTTDLWRAKTKAVQRDAEENERLRRADDYDGRAQAPAAASRAIETSHTTQSSVLNEPGGVPIDSNIPSLRGMTVGDGLRGAPSHVAFMSVTDGKDRDTTRGMHCVDYYHGKCHSRTHICATCPDKGLYPPLVEGS